MRHVSKKEGHSLELRKNVRVMLYLKGGYKQHKKNHGNWNWGLDKNRVRVYTRVVGSDAPN